MVSKYKGLGSRDPSLFQGGPIQNGSLMALWPRLFGFARTLCRSDEDAEDITAEAVFKVWKVLRNRAMPSNLVAYALQAVRRVCIDRTRSRNLPRNGGGYSLLSFEDLAWVSEKDVWRLFTEGRWPEYVNITRRPQSTETIAKRVETQKRNRELRCRQ